ncbi:YtxH domain-containing protein [Geothrix sp. 21YS21S-4]|uniref:YtxH domain-containing protein n=1 Tax=Geothrix sp. 21YS21S-4 TaxID=3068889 RepID=UPI0027B8D523|nr:YtxH domain-containing protein [Geothrix sp. 21YS21S-4]
MPESKPYSISPAILAFFAGAAVGAVVVALTTPRTGPEFRGDLKDLTRRAKRKAAQLADHASEAWNEVAGRTAQAGSDLKQGAADAAKDLKG